MELLAFKLPNGAEFKLPADWWNEAGMYTFDRESPFSMRIKICPSFSFAWRPLRFLQWKGDNIFGGLDRVRMVSVLHAIVSRTPLPPIEVEELLSGATCPYRLHHGAHRYFASVAAGFPSIPAVLWR